ncbi:hypothetical protein TNCV_2161001 [Trichonephila clavipes]|nr:hypothetical protein TNCV_2161001 [Trichonephila clavipes]
MTNLGDQFLPPTNLGRLGEELVLLGIELALLSQMTTDLTAVKGFILSLYDYKIAFRGETVVNANVSCYLKSTEDRKSFVVQLIQKLELQYIIETIRVSVTDIFQERKITRPKINRQSDEAHFWLNGYVNKQNCRIWSEANLQVYVETPLHPENGLFGALYGLVESFY